MSSSPSDKYDDDVESHIEKTETAVTTQYDIDPAEERRVTRKFDLRIIPWLFGIW